MTDMPVSPDLAVLFFLNAERIAGVLPGVPAADAPDVVAMERVLADVPDGRMPDVLGGLATVLLTVRPELRDLLAEVERRSAVRSKDRFDPAALDAALSVVRGKLPTVAALAVLVRLLGENHIKIGDVEIQTLSVFKDLADLLKFWTS